MAKATQQTVRINGARTIIRTSATGKITTKPAPPKEWELQAAQVRAFRAMPAYGKRFLLAGDQNAAKRGPRAQQEAIAAGMTPGEADLRIYLAGGQIRMIENKVGKGRLSTAQRDRHAALARLGHDVTVVSATTPADAASQAVELVQGWLAVA
ncbi:VRR-NUC domain-containing protein [Neorhizobium sp. JUb45]|uniref:VRR-NUC domain-containing protein n=1 Tax=Neorhizobium sp. JUb45 TaxID=2485113 RepID=UPI0010450BB9|nr:VRR-NUC domain-containing protein [Neorhizobium sp. JUb45]TCR07250.1 hypothetical protein EDF70_1011221 [Neorhizobium sp. JUb45]